MKLNELREQRAKKIEAAEAILKKADDEKRGLTDEQRDQSTTLLDEADVLKVRIDDDSLRTRSRTDFGDLSKTGQRRTTAPEIRDMPGNSGRSFATPGELPPHEWRDQATGKLVRMLGREHRMVDLVASEYPDEPVHELRIGRVLASILNPDVEVTEAEEPYKRAMSTNINTAGGALVADQLSARIVDLARNKSVILRAGAQIIPMVSDRMILARVAGDATFEFKGENQTFTGSQITLDTLGFTAHLLGTVVDMSRELSEDATNVVDVVEEALAMALAVTFDLEILTGSGDGILGIKNYGGSINTIAVGGSLDYDNLLDAIAAIEDDNHTPNAYVVSPNNKNVLSKLKVNAEANHYATAPPDVADLMRLVTKQPGDATVIVGDFTQVLIGMRQAVRVEVTTEGANRFDKHQLGIKITMRADANLAHAQAFNVLTGIS